MFGIGETELIIIVVFTFMVFGPDKLPGMGRTIGRALRQFREAQEDFTQVVQAEVVDPLNSAMNEPSARRRAEAAAAAAAEDADIEDGASPSRRKETFAERKARLQAEREAREAAAQEAPAPAEPAPSAQEEDAAAPAGPTPTPAPNPAEKDTPAATSAAALYALTPRRPAQEANVAAGTPPDGEGAAPAAIAVAAEGKEAADAE